MSGRFVTHEVYSAEEALPWGWQAPVVYPELAVPLALIIGWIVITCCTLDQLPNTLGDDQCSTFWHPNKYYCVYTDKHWTTNPYFNVWLFGKCIERELKVVGREINIQNSASLNNEGIRITKGHWVGSDQSYASTQQKDCNSWEIRPSPI